MFQCNEHVEMNKFLCSLVSTLMTIIDRQFYIMDSLSLVSLNGGCLVVCVYWVNHKNAKKNSSVGFG